MIKKILYFILFQWLRVFSLLPLSILYAIGYFFYILIYFIIGYRKVTVNTNLNLCFPEKSSQELAFIEKSFYKHFIQMIMESIKSFSISKSEIDDRIMIDPLILEKADGYYRQNKPILIIVGHYGNWEWAALRFGKSTKCQSYALYNPLKDLNFNKWIKSNRERFGTILLPSNEIKMYLQKLASSHSMTAFVGDQCPVHVENSYWTKFLGRDTPVFRGFEKSAKTLDATVWYCEMEKLKKGYYRLNFTHITDSPNDTADDEITEIHTRLLEQTISRRPEYWLWTHRRWKRSHLKPNAKP